VLAGCSTVQNGSSGGGGGDGGDGGGTQTQGDDGGGGDGAGSGDGGDMDSGDGGEGSAGSSYQPPDTVVITYPPTGWWAIIGDIVADQGILEDVKSEYGLEDTTFDIQRTWDGLPLFTSGQSDIAQFGSLEASRIGPEQDIPITVFGKVVPQFVEMLVATGGEYDPRETGGVQASIDKLASDNGNIGIGAWSSGSVPGSRIVMEEKYGYKFSQEEADFKITAAGFFAIAELITKGELDAGHASPMLGGARFYAGDDPELIRLYHVGDAIVDLGFGWPPLENQVCRTSFFEEHTPICQAYHDAKKEAMNRLHEDPVGVITSSQKYIENLGVQNEAEARFTVNYNINLTNDVNDLEPPKHPAVYDDFSLTEQWIEDDKKRLDKIAEKGMTNENWAEFVSYETF
jgi:hypothetical protein